MLTKSELARLYSVTTRTVTNWMYKDHRISFVKIGRVVRFNLPTVEQELARAGLVRAAWTIASGGKAVGN